MLSYFKSKISLIHSVARCLCIVIHTVYTAQSKSLHSPWFLNGEKRRKKQYCFFFNCKMLLLVIMKKHP